MNKLLRYVVGNSLFLWAIYLANAGIFGMFAIVSIIVWLSAIIGITIFILLSKEKKLVSNKPELKDAYNKLHTGLTKDLANKYWNAIDIIFDVLVLCLFASLAWPITFIVYLIHTISLVYMRQHVKHT